MNTLEYYYKEVNRLRSLGKEWNLSDDDIDRIIDDSFKFLEEHSTPFREMKLNEGRNWNKSLFKIVSSLVFFLLLMYVSYTYRKVAHNYIERNIQEIIYPGMKLIRKLMLPVIQTFPSLTEWYDEACLVGNPYFQVSDIDCWPCEGVKSILNLTSSNLSSDEYHSGLPFIYRDTNIKKVSYSDMVDLYKQKKSMFDKDAPRLEVSQNGWSNVEEVFTEDDQPAASHLTWKLNRLEPTRAMRSLFGIPKEVPGYVSGATPEKYVLIDHQDSAPYHLPATEGTTVFVVQGSGSRLLLLNPSPECSHVCHRVSIVLQHNHILWFNWWYWRGVSVPVNSGGISITYIGSYY